MMKNRFFIIISVVISLFASGDVTGTVFARGLSDSEMLPFSQNDILFYNPGECVDKDNASGAGASKLSGDSNEVKIWNYIVDADVEGVSDDVAVIAGLLGNFKRESGFDPFVMSFSGTYKGIYQTNFKGMISKVEAAAGNHWHKSGSSSSASDDENDKALQAELDFLIAEDGLDKRWSKFVKVVNDVKFKLGTTGAEAAADYADLAEIIIEVAIGGSDTPKNSVVSGEYAKGRRYQDMKKGEDHAREIYNKYANNPPTSSSATNDTEATSETAETNSGASGLGSGNTCAKLGEMRTEMWNAASQSDKEHFMYVVCGDKGVHSWGEDCSIAGVEGFMNQVVSKHGNDGSLSNWLSRQCPAFRGGASCSGSHNITSEEQGWIDQALAGSNNIKFAIGNATGGSGVGAGKIVCVWDGSKCREDVDYNVQGGKGKCNAYSPSASFGECWGLEGEDDWAEEMSQDCGGSSCSGKKWEGDYPQYNQGEYSDAYGGSTVAKAGCGPSSLAMLVTVATGQKVLPTDIASMTNDCPYFSTCGGSGRVSNTKKVCEKYGCEAKEIESTEKAMREALQEGWMLHFSGATPGGGNWAKNPFSEGGHYIGIFDIDDNDNVTIADSAGAGNAARRNRTMSLKDAIKNRHNAIMAIKGDGGGFCSDDVNYCEGETGSGDIKNGDVASLQNLVLKWAWPEYKVRTDRMPEYSEYMNKTNRYKGGNNGNDCAGFASNLIIESGWDPNFPNTSTGDMTAALSRSNTWENVTDQIKSNSDARPGDIIITKKKGHVLVYVGDIPGFGSPMASASVSGPQRAPMADYRKDITQYINDPRGYYVYRKK